MKNKDKQRGSVTLETSIVLPIFIFLFLFIYGLFSVVSAQNKMTHALIQSTKSLSLDSYLTENVESASEAGTKFWGGVSDMVLDIVRINNDPNFTSQTDWYSTSTNVSDIAKSRFVAYLTGGDVDAADNKLDDMGIVDGLNGVNFEVSIDDEIVTVTIKYTIEYWFDFWDMGEFPITQSVTSRLWK